MALDDDVLTAGGSRWNDLRAFDPGRIDPQTAVALHARAKAALTSEFNDADLPIIKDRACAGSCAFGLLCLRRPDGPSVQFCR